jgi:hypothetical protein
MIRGAVSLVVGLAGVAHADDFASAQKVRVDDLAWSLTASCETGDDLQQRQCRHVREASAKELAGKTLLVDAKAEVEVGAYSAAKKSVPLALAGCVDCGGVLVEGKQLVITGGTPTFDGGKWKTGKQLDTARQFNDESAAKQWIAAVGKSRVQLLVKVPEKVKWTIAGKEGLGLDIVGYRVYLPCEGTIIASKPESANVDPDKRACSK